jgi:hypothetical protein
VKGVSDVFGGVCTRFDFSRQQLKKAGHFFFSCRKSIILHAMAARVTHAHFERYAQNRLEFVRNIAALAEREDYLEVRRYLFPKTFLPSLFSRRAHTLPRNWPHRAYWMRMHLER